MRFTTFVSLCALLGLTAACGASSDTMSNEQPMQVHHVDLKSSGTLMAPEANEGFEENLEEVEEDDEYFGDETEVVEESDAQPVDRIQPRSDMKGPGRIETAAPAPSRIRPAATGDARLQADDLDEIQPEEGEEPVNDEIIDETTPQEHP